jgi:hypothetical protein
MRRRTATAFHAKISCLMMKRTSVRNLAATICSLAML